ncbi:hypothetical protein Tco_1053632 [Tanacetum coccineum]|uniref:Uncharacterized protein n=1 Tax=Tanacetum coccineum TaxID=301880 RepID=A0ABQ5GW20_9ASTR
MFLSYGFKVDPHHLSQQVKDDKEKEDTFDKKSDLKRFMNFVTKILSKSNARLVSILRKVIMGKPMALVMKLPWKIISNIPILKVIKEPIECMLEKLQGKERKQQKMKVTNLRHQESRKSQSHLSPK